jgi:hypothetical protein
MQKTLSRQVRVQVGNRVDTVDREVAPLVTELWKAGFEASDVYEYDGVVRVGLPSMEEAARLFNVVGRYEAGYDAFYERVWGMGVVVDSWYWQVYPLDMNMEFGPYVEHIPEKHDGPPASAFVVTLVFPAIDCSAAVRKLQQHNQGGGVSETKVSGGIYEVV